MAKYTSGEIRELGTAHTLLKKSKADMVRRIREVNQMGSLGLRADSKLADRRTWYHWFTLEASDPEKMVAEIEKHDKLFDKMSAALDRALTGDADAFEDLEEVRQEYLKQCDVDEDSIPHDTSRTVCGLHQDVVDSREKVVNTLMRAEWASARLQVRKMREDMKRAVEQIKELTKELSEAVGGNKELAGRFEKLMTVNDQLLAQQQALMEDNAAINAAVEEMAADQRQKEDCIVGLRGRIDELEAECRQLETRRRVLADEKAVIQSRLEKLQGVSSARTMLLGAPPRGFSDATQISDFGEQNSFALELLAGDNNCSAEEVIEVTKYRDFFRATEHVAGMVRDDAEGAEAEVLDLGERMSTLIREAIAQRDSTESSLLYCLYEDFVAQRNNLLRMLCILRFVLRRRQP